MLERIGPGTLVIVPGDREDVIVTVAAAHAGRRAMPRALRCLEPLVEETPGAVVDAALDGRALGLVLTGGYEPRRPRFSTAIQRRGDVRGDRPRGHVHGRVRGPRPPRQDPRR